MSGVNAWGRCLGRFPGEMPGGFLLAAIFCCFFLFFLAATVNTRFERRKWLLMTADDGR